MSLVVSAPCVVSVGTREVVGGEDWETIMSVAFASLLLLLLLFGKRFCQGTALIYGRSVSCPKNASGTVCMYVLPVEVAV